MKKHPVVLLVMPPHRRENLLVLLESMEVAILTADDCGSARNLLMEFNEVNVVITDSTLRDGNWCDLLTYVVDKGIHASVVIVSPVADERFWSEALWRGAYDLLVEPYSRSEVEQCLGGAVWPADQLWQGAAGSPASCEHVSKARGVANTAETAAVK